MNLYNVIHTERHFLEKIMKVQPSPHLKANHYGTRANHMKMESNNFILYFLLFFIFMYILCVCIPYNCTVHGADLINISLLVTLCIIVYVTNKILNLETNSYEATNLPKCKMNTNCHESLLVLGLHLSFCFYCTTSLCLYSLLETTIEYE